MRKTTLLLVLSLAASLLSIHLPWIYDESTGPPPVERIEYWYWSFMARRMIYQTNYIPEAQYVLFHQFWYRWEIVPDMNRILVMFATGDFSLGYLWEGYYILFLFQILTALFLFISLLISIVMKRWEASFKQTALYATTFLISLGAPIVGVNQYTRDWGFASGRDFVQFQIGFYLALVSTILTLAYVISFIVKMFRE